MNSLVVNKYKEKFDVYIGRGSHFGNPHPIGQCSICVRIHDRQDCLDEFRKYFLFRYGFDPSWRALVNTLKGKVLGCFCAPKDCHGDIIVEYLDKIGTSDL